MRRAAYNGEHSAFGQNKIDIVNQLYAWHFKNRQLIATLRGYSQAEYHSYASSYTEDEMMENAAGFLYQKLKEYGYTLFVEER